MSKNIWHHVVAVYGGGTSVTFYIDGVAQTLTIPAGALNTASGTAYIGYSGGQNIFQGDIDDLRLYNRALSAAEVMALYDAEK